MKEEITFEEFKSISLGASYGLCPKGLCRIIVGNKLVEFEGNVEVSKDSVILRDLSEKSFIVDGLEVQFLVELC